MIILSVVVGLSTKLSSNDCSSMGMASNLCLTSYLGNDGVARNLSGGQMTLWFGIFLASIIPNAAANVYKQYVLQGSDVDIVYAAWWSGNFQVLWGWLCIPMMWIKMPGQDLAPGQTLQAFFDTLSCMAGNVPHPGDEHCAISPTPWFWFGIYCLFNLSFNVLMLWLTKKMSATWAQIATVLCLDLTNIFGMIPFIAGGAAETMSLNDWLATALASLALWLYNLQPEGGSLKLKEAVDESESSTLEDGNATPM